MLKQVFRDDAIRLWHAPGCVVIHYYGPVSKLDVRPVRDLIQRASESTPAFACIAIVDSEAGMPSLTVQKDISDTMVHADSNIVVAHWFRANGFKAEVQKTVLDTIEPRLQQDVASFASATEVCNWLDTHAALTMKMSADELERIVSS